MKMFSVYRSLSRKTSLLEGSSGETFAFEIQRTSVMRASRNPKISPARLRESDSRDNAKAKSRQVINAKPRVTSDALPCNALLFTETS